jgi:two-component system, LytTR family, response regulator LytT
MNVLIVEDEQLAAKKLEKALYSIESDATVVATTTAVKTTVQWLQNNPAPDLIFMDVELSDGQSFEIYDHIEVPSPVIFVTSYDEYAVKAFKVNGVDYLLKPVQKADLADSLKKFHNITKGASSARTNVNLPFLIEELQQKLQPREFRKRFLVRLAKKLISVEVSKIAYFYYDGRLIFFKTLSNEKYIVDYTMDELEKMLDPSKYFRISRSMFVAFSAIKQIHDYSGHRLQLELTPNHEKEIVVSREKVVEFKKWVGK